MCLPLYAPEWKLFNNSIGRHETDLFGRDLRFLVCLVLCLFSTPAFLLRVSSFGCHGCKIDGEI